MTTLKIKVGETFIDEIECAEMHEYKDGAECYQIILKAWYAGKKKKKTMKSLTVKVPIEYCPELLSWAEFTASASDDDAYDYLALRGYARRLVRRVREQGYEYKDGVIVEIATKEPTLPKTPVRKPSSKPKPVRKIGKTGWLLDELLGADGEAEDKSETSVLKSVKDRVGEMDGDND